MIAGRLFLAALLVAFAASLPPQAASAGDVALAPTVLTPPKGRLVARKRLVHPTLPAPSGRGGGAAARAYAPEAFRWFWTEVSASHAEARPGRWGEVLSVVEQARAKGQAIFGSAATAERILAAYGPYLEREAARHRISLPLLVAVIAVESGGNPGAVSPKGAGGLMQLMPGTAARFGVGDRYLPAENIRGGAQYLDWLLRQFREDAVLALAGYNAGEGAVLAHAGVPPYGETRDYIAKVAGAWAAARTLCAAPPRGAREACELR